MIKEEVKTRRMKELATIAKDSMRRFHELNIGDRRGVIFETKEEGIYTGYTDNYIKVKYKPPLDAECVEIRTGRKLDRRHKHGDAVSRNL